MDDEKAWRARIDEERAGWDALYQGPDSPLPPERRAGYRLRWYEPDPAYRVVAEIPRGVEPRRIVVASTGGDDREYLDLGPARFRLHGKDLALHAWMPTDDDEEPYLFVVFRDQTSGTETYGGGRYWHGEVPDAAGRFELDLNRAYHPYCVHEDSWSCVLPPPENRLDVPVRAGERL